MAIYDIDLLRAVFVDKLNDSSIFLASFYEQLQDDEQISRYVDNIKELLSLQNREKETSNFKAMGIIAQSGNAEIINIKRNYVSPLEYQARFDIQLEDRDYVLGKLKQLIDDCRGRKFDIIQLTNGQIKVLVPNTINITSDKPELRLGTTAVPNFFKVIGSYNPTTATTDWSNDVDNQFHNYANTTPFPSVGVPAIMWFIYNNKLYQRSISLSSASPVVYSYGTATEVGTIEGLYKLSLSFDGIQSQEPYINNGVDRVFLFFSGSATITKDNVTLGNDIVLTTIRDGKDTGTIYEVEPTEIPASLSVNDDTFQTYASGFRTQDRNMAIGNKMTYSFIYENTNALFNDLYEYARYGLKYNADGTFVAPTFVNLIFTIKEYRYSFGVLRVNKFYAKLGDVSTSNTNGDVMTLTLAFKVGAY
jgi:hypothetical protein